MFPPTPRCMGYSPASRGVMLAGKPASPFPKLSPTRIRSSWTQTHPSLPDYRLNMKQSAHFGFYRFDCRGCVTAVFLGTSRFLCPCSCFRRHNNGRRIQHINGGTKVPHSSTMLRFSSPPGKREGGNHRFPLSASIFSARLVSS